MDQQQQKDLSVEMEICHNCKREVPQPNYLMHVAHCARNVAVCPVCGDAVPKARLKEHRQQQHALVECPACRHRVQAGALAQHRAASCGRRQVACEICELELPHAELPEHEYHCGARTERCPECGELVMLRYRRLHLDSNHGFLKLDDEPGPAPSWQAPPPVAASKAKCVSPPPEPAPAPRDAPRALVTPYDASEDLRAKVQLARHDLNHIKHSYMRAGEERRPPAPAPPGPELPATLRAPRAPFVTNLVPYEKNKSYQVNALPLGAEPPQPQPPRAGYFNYLGAPQEPPPGAPPQPKPQPKPQRLTNGTGAVPRATRRKAPAPPVPQPVAAPAPPATPTDDVALPCEFCNEMVAASRLVLHETACRPDLAQLRVDDSAARGPAPGAAVAPPSPEVQLPCEFCLGLYPASRLLSHQALCDA